jgi:hypothetical protein
MIRKCLPYNGGVMEIVDIYNLDVGNKLYAADVKEVVIGDLVLTLAPDYEDRCSKLFHGDLRHEENVLSSSGKVTFSEKNEGEWVLTASVKCQPGSNQSSSILAFQDITDHGIWDLCEILTFLTGRRVTTVDEIGRYNHKSIGVHACAPSDVLAASRLAMENRN